MVVTYCIKFFHTGADRHNGILMSFLLLVVETIILLLDILLTTVFRILSNKGVDCFRKKLHRRCLTEFWMRLRMSHQNYLNYLKRQLLTKTTLCAKPTKWSNTLTIACVCLPDHFMGLARKGLVSYNLQIVEYNTTDIALVSTNENEENNQKQVVRGWRGIRIIRTWYGVLNYKIK